MKESHPLRSVPLQKGEAIPKDVAPSGGFCTRCDGKVLVHLVPKPLSGRSSHVRERCRRDGHAIRRECQKSLLARAREMERARGYLHGADNRRSTRARDGTVGNSNLGKIDTSLLACPGRWNFNPNRFGTLLKHRPVPEAPVLSDLSAWRDAPRDTH